MYKPAHVYYDRQEDVPRKRGGHLEISEGAWPPPRRQRNDLRMIERLESSKATLDQIDREGSTQLASLALGHHWKARDMLQDLNGAHEKIGSDESITHRHFVGVASPSAPTRRAFLAYLTGSALFSLAACPPNNQRKAKKCPAWSSRAPKTSRICPFNARETLWREIQPSRRHGGVGVVRPDYSKPPPTNYARGPTLTRRKTSAALLKPTTTPISWHSLWTTTPNIASRIR